MSSFIICIEINQCVGLFLNCISEIKIIIILTKCYVCFLVCVVILVCLDLGKNRYTDTYKIQAHLHTNTERTPDGARGK